MSFVRRFIVWAYRKGHYDRRWAMDEDKHSFKRIAFLWRDEWIGGEGEKVWHRPPWYRPFNIFLHFWVPQHNGEEMHDHPRWSVTIVLHGKLVEITPWERKVLTPGSIVIRSRKYIHSIYIPQEYRGKTWTLFIVGRRNHRQNKYKIRSQSLATAYKNEPVDV